MAEENNPQFSIESKQEYYPLGQKTLFMLIVRKSGIFFLMLFVLFAGLALFSYVPDAYFNIAVSAIFIYLAALILVLIITFCIGWLEYYRYGITVSDKDLKIKRGLIATEEIGVPYRRIRDIKIQRSLVDQIFGVSDIVVVLSDFEESNSSSEDSIIFLPSIEKNIALQIQDSVIKKSQVEQIHIVGGQKIV